jgi:glycosyltransferase involved in cell wall biosynthesis
VRKTLSRELNIRDDTVDLVHEFVSGVPVGVAEQRVLREEVRRRLGLPSDVFVVGGCGGLGWRKGTDLFLQVARIVCKAKGDHKVKFLWIGGEAEDKAALEFAYDLRAMGLEESCIRVPATRDVLQYYSAMDVLAVTSREDPFPLVMLEAGSYGVPIVCFADSGGAPEYAGGDAGLVAPYLDVAAFAANLVRLQEMPDLRERLGAAALTKVRTHYTAENQVPKIQKIIERCLVGRASS